MSVYPRRVAAWSATALLAVLAASPPARAQAFVPSKGEGAVAVVFQDATSRWHLLPTERFDRGLMKMDSLLVDVSIGLGRNVALSVSLPYVVTKYTGTSPHRLVSGEEIYRPNFAVIDDGKYHGTFQDVRVDLRYNVTRRGLVITPFVGTILPSHDYEFFSHAAAGRNLREVQAGVFVARLLEPVLPRAFVQGRYSYGFAERILDISHNRSNASLEFGYFVNPRFRVFGIATGQRTHGGIDLTPAGRAALGSERFIHHDQITKDHQFNLGAGVAFSLTDSVDIFASAMRTMTGRNGHLLARGLTVGASFGFGRRTSAPSSLSAAAQRCVCLKNIGVE